MSIEEGILFAVEDICPDLPDESPPGDSPEQYDYVFLMMASLVTGKLIAAPYGPWREWAGKAGQLNATRPYTIRRLDSSTIKPLIKDLL